MGGDGAGANSRYPWTSSLELYNSNFVPQNVQNFWEERVDVPLRAERRI